MGWWKRIKWRVAREGRRGETRWYLLLSCFAAGPVSIGFSESRSECERMSARQGPGAATGSEKGDGDEAPIVAHAVWNSSGIFVTTVEGGKGTDQAGSIRYLRCDAGCVLFFSCRTYLSTVESGLCDADVVLLLWYRRPTVFWSQPADVDPFHSTRETTPPPLLADLCTSLHCFSLLLLLYGCTTEDCTGNKRKRVSELCPFVAPSVTIVTQLDFVYSCCQMVSILMIFCTSPHDCCGLGRTPNPTSKLGLGLRSEVVPYCAQMYHNRCGCSINRFGPNLQTVGLTNSS